MPFNIMADVIVANPPWGWRIGCGAASEQIAMSLMRQFPQAACRAATYFVDKKDTKSIQKSIKK